MALKDRYKAAITTISSDPPESIKLNACIESGITKVSGGCVHRLVFTAPANHGGVKSYAVEVFFADEAVADFRDRISSFVPQ